MARPHIEDIRDIEGVKLWMADHDGRIDAWWKQQFKHNSELKAKVSALEKRIYWISGVMAGLGGAAGSGISALVQ